MPTDYESNMQEPKVTTNDFHVRWDHPGDAQHFWMLDRVNMPPPYQATALEASALIDLVFGSFNAVAESFNISMWLQMRRINTFLYFSLAFAPPGDDRQLNEAALQVGTQWRADVLPELRRMIDKWRSFDLSGAKLADLRAHFEWTTSQVRRAFDLHFLVVLPALLAVGLFEEYYRDLFGGASGLGAYGLLAGYGNETTAANRALWRLARCAEADQQVREALECGKPDELPAQLAGSDGGRRFLAEWNAYLDEYGRRGDGWSIRQPSWREAKMPVVRGILHSIAHPVSDPAVLVAEQAAERDRLTVEARSALAGYPPVVTEEFEKLLSAARGAIVVQEDHDFWIDIAVMHELRCVLVEIGQRLERMGAIAAADDVWHLTLGELGKGLASGSRGQFIALVDGRKAEMDAFRTRTPPPGLGAMPSEPPPDTAMWRALEKVFGAPPVEPAAGSGPVREVRGTPGSAGLVRGRARLVLTLEDAAKLNPGEVLVTVTTAPQWTSLFGSAAALVTDTGGVLCHAAILAREYGIPAVVGTGFGTNVLRDGQLVEVDGNLGVVRMVDDAGC